LKIQKQYNQSLGAAQSGVSHACQGLDPEFSQYWEPVLDLFMKCTSAGAGTIGDLLTNTLESSDYPQSSVLDEAAQLKNLREDITDIRDHLSSKAVTNDSFTVT
jgi:hypothetical protein